LSFEVLKRIAFLCCFFAFHVLHDRLRLHPRLGVLVI
jgi:hypothetical protein